MKADFAKQSKYPCAIAAFSMFDRELKCSLSKVGSSVELPNAHEGFTQPSYRK
jgi:hypothetical protein